MSAPPPRRPSAAVLAPTPRLTVTLERLHDHDDIHLHAGGQALWQARMLAALGLQVRVCGHFAGEAGAVAHALITNTGIEVHDVAANGTCGAYVHDRRSGERREVGSMAATPIERHHLDDLYGRFLVDALAADVVLLGGPDEPHVIPDGFYRRIASDLRSNHKLVIADLSGAPQEAALAGGITVLKVSDEELGASEAATEEVLSAAVGLARRGVEQVLVTRATAPTDALIAGEALTVQAPVFQAVDPRGAGDSFTAAYAAFLALGRSPREALRHAAAAGALNVTRHGLAAGERDRIIAFARGIDVRSVDLQPGPTS